MNQNSMAVIILCSHLCIGENIKPFALTEWTRLADRLLYNKTQPYELLSYTDDDFKSKLNFSADEVRRINKLIERSGSIAFEIEKYANMGINIMTRADSCYPRTLKKKLGKSCPLLFYYAGNPGLIEKKSIGFVGSRSIETDDEVFTAATVTKINSNGSAVVSGGAKGIDSISRATSIKNGNFCIEYISDSLVKKIKSRDIISAIVNNRLIVLSMAKPDAGFTIGSAMTRNKFIYAQSDGTVIIKSDYEKGGTWNGAVENLSKQWSLTFCWNNANYKGNLELINRGAIPVDETWDGDVLNYEKSEHKGLHEQLSLLNA